MHFLVFQTPTGKLLHCCCTYTILKLPLKKKQFKWFYRAAVHFNVCISHCKVTLWDVLNCFIVICNLHRIIFCIVAMSNVGVILSCSSKQSFAYCTLMWHLSVRQKFNIFQCNTNQVQSQEENRLIFTQECPKGLWTFLELKVFLQMKATMSVMALQM